MNGAVSCKRFKETIIDFMKTLLLYDDRVLLEIPGSWEKYGDLVLFKNHFFVSSNWFVAGEQLWQLICDLLKCKRIGLKGSISNDDFRSPKVSLVYGEPGDVIFIDNNIKYSWDLERSMFCRGNACERHRIASLDCSNEVIVDLFAGIGYFSLPYLVKANAKLVHSCEWNPYAVKSLRKNLELNKVSDNCVIYEGDNRKCAPKNVGNRINVGLIPDSERFWRTACESLLSSGGIIYIHQNVTSRISENEEHPSCLKCDSLIKGIELFSNKMNFCISVTSSYPSLSVCEEKYWKHVEWFKFALHISHTLLSHLEDIHNSKWKVTIKEYFKIKSYAPHIDHLVFGAYCYPV